MTTNFDLNKAWSETTAGTDSGATATHAAESNVAHVVTHVSGHGDADATIQLRDGSTPLAEWKIDVSVEGFQFLPQNGVWVGTPGNAVSAVISASSADCQVNICGFSLP
jgi:hypothetical protein